MQPEYFLCTSTKEGRMVHQIEGDTFTASPNTLQAGGTQKDGRTSLRWQEKYGRTDYLIHPGICDNFRLLYIVLNMCYRTGCTNYGLTILKYHVFCKLGTLHMYLVPCYLER